MQTIKFNDANDIVVSVELEDVAYKLRILWNADGGFWTLHLWDNDRNPLLTNVKVVPNFPLLMTHHTQNIPRGEFLVLTDLETLTRTSFADNLATLCYVTESEWYDGTV